MNDNFLNYSANKPKVSIIMNCLNCSKYLREAIDSVYSQTYKDWEIIFWDNASTDNSAEIAKSYDEKLRYFKGEQTVAVYAARNFALKQVEGEFIAFLDCDDKWLPEKLEEQIKLFSREKVGLVFSNTILYNQKTGNKRILYKKNPPTGSVFNQLLSRYFLPIETVIIRRTCLDRLSEWFDSRFNMVGDADLFLRIAYNWELDYVDKPLAIWRIHDDSMTWNKIGLFGKEWKLILDKYQNLFDSFNSRYHTEIEKVKALSAYYEAMEEWKNNNRSKVRAIVLPHIIKKPKLLFVYLLSVFPFKQYTRLLRVTGRHA